MINIFKYKIKFLYIRVTITIQILVVFYKKSRIMIFAIYNKKLKRITFGIGCDAHMLHNVMHNNANILPTDI